MPRPNLGPKLIPLRKKGWSRTLLYIQWTEGGRTKLHGTGFDTANSDEVAAAQAYFRDWLQARARTRSNGPADRNHVWAAHVIEDYVTEHGRDVASAESLAICARPLLYFFMSDTIATITPNRVHAYWDWRRRHSLRVVDKDAGTVEVVQRAISDGTIIRELAGTLRPAIQHAIKQRRLISGVYHVPVPTAPPGRQYWITRSEVARLLWEMRRDKRSRLHLPLYAMVALYTGQRRRAILDLTWAQVDLVLGRIDFNPPGRPQTKKQRPIIPIPHPLLAALRRAQRRASSTLVIAYRGKPVRDVKTGFNSAAERAQIPDCTSHTLRHTAGTWMAQRGVPLREIAGYLGHSEQRTTELYAHHHPDFMQNARRAFERPE
jgi:integrase